MADKKKTLAEMIRGSVGEASLAAMDAAAPVSGERTIENITSEIIQLKTDAGNAILGIGQRLIEAKAKLQHGEWAAWLAEEVDFSERIAQQYMQLYQGFSSNPNALSDLGKTKALKLLSMPREEREEFMEAHDVPNMSTRELEDAIRERDEARKAAERWEKSFREKQDEFTAVDKKLGEANWDLNEAKKENALLQKQVKELKEAPKELFTDEAAIKKAADEARRKTVEEWQKKTAKLDEELRKTEEKLKEAREKAKQGKADVEAGKAASEELDAAKKAEAEAKAEADRLRAELAEAQKAAKAAAVAGDAEVSEFKLYFGLAQENINKMRGLLLKVRSREDKTTGEKLSAAMTALADAVKEAAK